MQSSTASDTGIVYYLPKVLLKITIPYTLREETKTTQGIINKSSSVYIKKPIEIAPIIVPDKNNRSVISYSDITKNIFLESGLTFELNGGGILTSVEADLKDKTWESIEKFVSAGIKIASFIAAVAGPQIPPELEGVKKRIDSIYKQLGKKLTKDQIKELTEELTALNTIITIYNSNNQLSINETDTAYTIVIDPEDFKDDTVEKGFIYHEIKPDGLIYKNALPSVVIRLKLNRSEISESCKTVLTDSHPGIAYRVPMPILTTVTIKSTVVFQDYINFPQFGSHAYVNVDSKGFKDQKTKIVFSDTKGGIVTYSITSGASGDKIAESLSNSADNLSKAVSDIKASIQTGDIKNEKALIDSQKELLDSKKELEEAKQAYEEALKKHYQKKDEE